MFAAEKGRLAAADPADRRDLQRRPRSLSVVVVTIALVLLTVYCRELLAGAQTGRDDGGGTRLLLMAGGFLFASLFAVVVHMRSLAHRVAGPEFRLIQAIRRIRSGDLAFRVHLRRGDLLGGLASECNDLLEWLNCNPPAGAVTGTDVIDIEPEPAMELAPVVTAEPAVAEGTSA
jgi:hypothetical protein